MRKPGAICLECRTALRAGESCYVDGTHEVAYLASEEGRERLVQRTWGAAGQRLVRLSESRRRDRLALAMGLVPSVSTFLLLLEHLPVGPLHFFGPLVVALGFAHAGRRLAGYRGPESPAGVTSTAESSGGLSGPRGIVDGASQLLAPASASQCVAYSLELHFVAAGDDRLMFRDAMTTGFTVVLDGGRLAVVPKGRVILVGSVPQLVDFDNIEIDEYLRRFDPLHMVGTVFDPLCYNVVRETVVRPGDRVELMSDFEPTVNAAAPATDYRRSAPFFLAPLGVPVLRFSNG